MDRRLSGIRPRGNSIVLDFTYQGIRCRETLRTKPTKTAIKEATRKREAVLHAIAMNNFDYANFFPDSPRAIELSKNSGRLVTIETTLKKWLKAIQLRCQPSTIKDYNSIVYTHLIPAFGHLALSDLSAELVNNWIMTLGISNKRINNVLIPLRQVFKDALFDDLIERDPMLRVRPLPKTTKEPKPFRPSEIDKILQELTGQDKNLIQFAFWSGLRSSELIALRWEDIDFDNNRFHVRVAIVRRKEKAPKTAAGHRTIDFNPMSLAAIKSQQKFTKDQHRVFNDSKYDMPWLDEQAIRKRLWIPALKRANIEYRNPYQTRHTFASTMLSNGKNPLWVAQQMGHSDWGMIIKVYGRWIPPE